MEQQPFYGWIEANLDRLFGYAYSLSEDRETSSDLVQECVLRAIGAARRPSDEAAFRAWLFRILRNAYIDRLRRTAREIQLDDGDDFVSDAPWDGDARMIDIVTVRIALAQLSVAHREIIALVDFAGLSYTETAAVLDIAVGTVMSRLSRARATLLKVMANGNVTPLSRMREARR